MKTQLTTFILFAAMTTGCGADDLVALEGAHVVNTPAVEQVAVIQSHVDTTTDVEMAETAIEPVETNDGETAHTIMAQPSYVRMDETNEETDHDVELEADADVAEYEFIVPSKTTKTLTTKMPAVTASSRPTSSAMTATTTTTTGAPTTAPLKTEFKQAEAVLIDEDFTFGLGGFDFCSPLRCTGDNCPTVSAGAVQLNAADNYLCLPSIQVNARGRLVEHAFTINANDALHRIVIRDADADAWRVVLNLRDGLIEYQSPQTGERTAISVDMDNTEGEQFFRVIFDSNAQATYIVLGDTFLGELPFNAPRVDNVMFSTHGAQSQDNAPSLDDYRVARFN